MAKAKGSGRKKGGWMRVRKTREVRPDGAHAFTWTYQAKLADALAAQRDLERSAEAEADAAQAAEQARTARAAVQAAAEAKRQAQLAPRLCKRCEATLPPEAFERCARAYNGRMGCCRPCAKLIRDRKAAPVGRREPPKEKRVPPPRPCRCCETLFVPAHHSRAFCTDTCRDQHGKARHQADYYAAWERRRQLAKAWRGSNRDKARAHRRKAYHADPEGAKAAHAEWVARNRERVNAYQRECAQRRAAILDAKEQFREDGFFLLIRAGSGFWRGDAPGRRIGQTETIMARYERVLAEWVVLPPVIATSETLRFATRLRLAEQRRKARRYGSSGKVAV